MNSLHVKTGDTAVVLSGKEKGKRGKVIKVMPKKGMVVLEGVNFVTRHQKPTRPAAKFLEDGSKVMVCKHCGETI